MYYLKTDCSARASAHADITFLSTYGRSAQRPEHCAALLRGRTSPLCEGICDGPQRRCRDVGRAGCCIALRSRGTDSGRFVAVGRIEFCISRMVVIAASFVRLHGHIFVTVAIGRVRGVLVAAAAGDGMDSLVCVPVEVFALAGEGSQRRAGRRQQICRQQRQSLYGAYFHRFAHLSHAFRRCKYTNFLQNSPAVHFDFLRQALARAHVLRVYVKCKGRNVCNFVKN